MSNARAPLAPVPHGSRLVDASGSLSRPADLILFNGKILTVDPNFSIVEALAIKADRIVASGTNSQVYDLAAAGTVLIDLEGRTVIPGLVDGHHHFMNRAARAYFGVRLDFYSNVRDLVNSVGEKARTLGPGKLVMSTAGNAIELLDELRAPTIEELDAVAPYNPVILTMEDGLRVNTRMLERAGLTPDTAVPAGGSIGRDPNTGMLNGIVAGTAVPLVLDKASDLGGSPRVYTPEQMREAFLWGQREANAIGLTGIRHPHTEIYEMRVLQGLWATGELTLRIAMDVGFEPHHQSPEELGRKLSAWGLTQPFGDEWLRFHGVGELGIDQSTDGMLLSWKYHSLPPAAGGNPEYRGIMRIDQDTPERDHWRSAEGRMATRHPRWRRRRDRHAVDGIRSSRPDSPCGWSTLGGRPRTFRPAEAHRADQTSRLDREHAIPRLYVLSDLRELSRKGRGGSAIPRTRMARSRNRGRCWERLFEDAAKSMGRNLLLYHSRHKEMGRDRRQPSGNAGTGVADVHD